MHLSRAWSGEHRRGLMVAAWSALGLFGLVAGYGAQSHIDAETKRAALRVSETAALTKAELRQGAILFVSVAGNLCRRRWIDNATWMLHDGQNVVCGEAAGWNATMPVKTQNIGMRIDAVRSGFVQR